MVKPSRIQVWSVTEGDAPPVAPLAHANPKILPGSAWLHSLAPAAEVEEPDLAAFGAGGGERGLEAPV